MSFRVAMVGACPYPVPQGSQVLLRETALALAQRGHEVHLVVYGQGLGEDTTGLPMHRGAHIPGAHKTAAGPSFAKPAQDWALTVALRRVVRERGIELVHAHNYEGLLVALAARKRPIVYHAHNALSDELPWYFGGAAWTGHFGAWLDRTWPRRADHIIAPHQRLADYLVSCGCAPDRITVVPPAVAPWPVEEKAVESVPPVLYTGNLDSYQNLDFLVEVMRRVRAVEPRARLEIATAQSRPFAEGERIDTPDFDTLRRILARDCVFVCPRVSWSGYPIKLLNGMAAGKPIVACGSVAYPLEHGRSGLIAPDNDSEAFAAAILKLLAQPPLRGQLGAQAREALIRNHSPENAAAAMEGVYSEALRRMDMIASRA